LADDVLTFQILPKHFIKIDALLNYSWRLAWQDLIQISQHLSFFRLFHYSLQQHAFGV
jgi:hypothetical protein